MRAVGDVAKVTANAKIGEFIEGQRVRSLLLLEKRELLTKKDGSPYLSLLLRDSSGTIEARIWEKTEPLLPLLQEGEVVEVEGEVKIYNGRLQLVVHTIEPSSASVEELRPHGSLSREELKHGIEELKAQIKDPHYRELAEFFFAPGPMLDEILLTPGAKSIHHNWVGGLAHHLISVTKGSIEIGKLYPELDMDLIVCGALLHDIGKVREMAWEGLSIEYTDEGRLLGHVAIGLKMVSNALKELNTPKEKGIKILHIIASHHGEPEMGALKRPKFPEALLIHYVDQIDAKVQGSLSFMEADKRLGNWTTFHRPFQRFLYKG